MSGKCVWVCKWVWLYLWTSRCQSQCLSLSLSLSLLTQSMNETSCSISRSKPFENHRPASYTCTSLPRLRMLLLRISRAELIGYNNGLERERDRGKERDTNSKWAERSKSGWLKQVSADCNPPMLMALETSSSSSSSSFGLRWWREATSYENGLLGSGRL